MKKVLLALLVAAAVALPTSAQTRVDEVRQVAADATVTVENISGSLRLTGWDRAEVHVTGTLGRGLEKVEITGSASRLDIRVVYPQDCHDCGGADLELKVPAGCRLEVSTVSADIDADQLKGEVRLETVSGELAVTASSPSLRVQTVSGDLTVRGAGQRLDAETVSGTLSATVSTLVDGQLETVSGEIRIEADLAGNGRLEAQTVSGDVELRVPGSVGAEFDVRTFSGSIGNDFGQEARRTSEHGSGRELRFTNGSGAARVSIKTLSGDVRILKR